MTPSPDPTVPPAGAWAAGAAAALERAGFRAADARGDVAVIARTWLGWDTATWMLRQREPLPTDAIGALDAAIARRARHEPVAYITGVREFYGRRFAVTPDVLIPRPETELVIDEALREWGRLGGAADARPPVIMDIGTGSGCLAITLAAELPGARLIATDTSRAALIVAAGNARALGVADRIAWRLAPLTAGVETPIDIVVTNPPYVRDGDRATLAPDVRDYEPAPALFAGVDGLDVIRALLPAASDVLRAGGAIVMEIGAGQAEDVEAITRAASDLHLDRIAPDLAGIPRVAVLRRVARRG